MRRESSARVHDQAGHQIIFLVSLAVFTNKLALASLYIFIMCNVGCFLLFNVGCYFGIVLSSFCKWPDATKSGSMILLYFAIARIVFIPFFILCNIEPFNRKVTNVSVVEFIHSKF